MSKAYYNGQCNNYMMELDLGDGGDRVCLIMCKKCKNWDDNSALSTKTSTRGAKLNTVGNSTKKHGMLIVFLAWMVDAEHDARSYVQSRRRFTRRLIQNRRYSCKNQCIV